MTLHRIIFVMGWPVVASDWMTSMTQVVISCGRVWVSRAFMDKIKTCSEAEMVELWQNVSFEPVEGSVN